MDTRVAIMAIIVEDKNKISVLNDLLHDYSDVIIGRMGIPQPRSGLNLISIAIDATQDTISALAGKIGRIEGFSVKTVYASGRNE